MTADEARLQKKYGASISPSMGSACGSSRPGVRADRAERCGQDDHAADARHHSPHCWRVEGAWLRATAPGIALRRRIGYLPGELEVGRTYSRRNALRHLAQISGLSRPGRIETLAERLALTSAARCVRCRSNRQKLPDPSIHAPRPELLILDEPTSGLDPGATRVSCDGARAWRGGPGRHCSVRTF